MLEKMTEKCDTPFDQKDVSTWGSFKKLHPIAQQTLHYFKIGHS